MDEKFVPLSQVVDDWSDGTGGGAFGRWSDHEEVLTHGMSVCVCVQLPTVFFFCLSAFEWGHALLWVVLAKTEQSSSSRALPSPPSTDTYIKPSLPQRFPGGWQRHGRSGQGLLALQVWPCFSLLTFPGLSSPVNLPLYEDFHGCFPEPSGYSVLFGTLWYTLSTPTHPFPQWGTLSLPPTPTLVTNAMMDTLVLVPSWSWVRISINYLYFGVGFLSYRVDGCSISLSVMTCVPEQLR
jgi:hypothetical protein